MLRSLGFGLGLTTFAKSLRVSVSENLVSFDGFGFKKNLVSKKSIGFGFGKFGFGKNVSVSVSVKILVSSFSGAYMLTSESALFSFYQHTGEPLV